MEYDGLNLFLDCLQEFENTGIYLNVDGTFIPNEYHKIMIIEESVAEKIVNNLLVSRFIKFKNMELVTSEIIRKTNHRTL
jgi:hypothetical protein